MLEMSFFSKLRNTKKESKTAEKCKTVFSSFFQFHSVQPPAVTTESEQKNSVESRCYAVNLGIKVATSARLALARQESC